MGTVGPDGLELPQQLLDPVPGPDHDANGDNYDGDDDDDDDYDGDNGDDDDAHDDGDDDDVEENVSYI